MHTKFRSFRFERPASLEEALGIFERADDAVFIAGGTALVPSWRAGTSQPPATVISIDRVVPRHVLKTATGLQVGALATVADILRSSELEPSALRDALSQMATPQIRERATVAGNVALRAPDSTLIPALLVQGASLEARLGSGAVGPSLADLLESGPVPQGLLITSLALPVADPARTASATVRLGATGASASPSLSAAASIGFASSGAPAWARLSISPFRDAPVLLHLRAEGEGLRAFGDRIMREAAALFSARSDLAGPALGRSNAFRVVTKRALEQAVRRYLVHASHAGASDGVAYRGQRAPAIAGHRAERDVARGPAGAPEPNRG